MYIYLYLFFNALIDSVHLIDMEYCDLNYAAYDIGNHFCEFTGKFSLQLNYYCLKTMRCRYVPLMSPQKNETRFNLNPIANHYPFLFKIYLSFFFILLTNVVIVVVVFFVVIITIHYRTICNRV